MDSMYSLVRSVRRFHSFFLSFFKYDFFSPHIFGRASFHRFLRFFAVCQSGLVGWFYNSLVIETAAAEREEQLNDFYQLRFLHLESVDRRIKMQL